MKFIGMLVVMAAVGLTGCVADVDEGEESDVGDMESPALTEEAFVPEAYNYTCAEWLGLKTAPNGNVIGYLPYRTKVFARAEYKTVWENGAERTYVLVRPHSGNFQNQWGWVYRGWIDQNCH